MTKVVSTAQRFSEQFGGKWRYDRHGTWECDDGDRYINRVLTGQDLNGEYTGETGFYLYSRSHAFPTQAVHGAWDALTLGS